ncbi:selenoprotein K-like [Lineus longissimus]|uniref:selenoprotein K-like n=1 Tax=Lineus longissimus TaxID=88925 RepID=UPI00315C5008
MVYVSEGGQVLDSRSPWRLSIIPEFFFGIMNFFVLFFKTMFQPSLTKNGSNQSSDYRPDGGGGGPRRRMGGFRGGGGGPSAPPMAGGG